MNIFRRFLAVLLLAGGLSACGDLREFQAFDGVPQLSQFGGGGEDNAPAIQRNAANGDVELILHPVPVWDESGVSASKTIAADGREFAARHRQKGFLEKPTARAGLFWHSRLDYVFMPVVVLGPPADIRRAEIHAGGNRALLRRAEDNFQFTPARGRWDSDKVSSAVFRVKPAMLRAVSDADTARLIVSTDRGVLKLGLDVVGGDSLDDYRRNARVLFAQFAEQMAAERTDG